MLHRAGRDFWPPVFTLRSGAKKRRSGVPSSSQLSPPRRVSQRPSPRRRLNKTVLRGARESNRGAKGGRTYPASPYHPMNNQPNHARLRVTICRIRRLQATTTLKKCNRAVLIFCPILKGSKRRKIAPENDPAGASSPHCRPTSRGPRRASGPSESMPPR